MNTTYKDYLERAKARHGTQFSEDGLDPRFIPYYNNGARIRVETCGMVLTGTIGVTTGHTPCFLLMRTARSIGSSWTLGPYDTILAVKQGRTYQPVAHV